MDIAPQFPEAMQHISPQFKEVMKLPHARPAYGVNAPALFRHIGFLIEDTSANPLTATDAGESEARRKRFADDLNAALCMIQRECRVASADMFSFCVATKDARGPRIHHSNTLLTPLNELPAALAGWRARMRVDIHSEYYFITFILDQQSSKRCLADIGETERRLSDTRIGKDEAEQFIQRYYEDVWQTLHDGLKEGFDALPGRCFTEFRSIVLRDHGSPFVKLRDTSATEGAPDEDRFSIPRLPPTDFKAARGSMRGWLTRNIGFVERILQLKELTTEVDKDANCVLCEFLDGAAIYGSSVRQKTVAAQADDGVERIEPLRYFLLYNGLSKYQLGRLVRRTHVLGELRVAAVLDMDRLTRASMRIRALGNKIDRHLQGGRATLQDRDLQAVLRELNLISQEVPGGLMYRINRSRYYAGAFRQRVEEMRVARLEGWQAYNEFFSRNLYHVFDDIERIGNRYEALASRVTRLTIAHNSERIESLVSEMTRADKTIAKIQELGEWIGFVAVTYYGGHILQAVASYLAGKSLAAAHDEHLLLGYALAAASALAVRHYWRKKWAGSDEIEPSPKSR